MPDQRYYTKTNFFTITNGEGVPTDMSIADKYAHMHSQKMSRRSNKGVADGEGGQGNADQLSLHNKM